ncbi:TetR/AcrR family transcriptional regulator [Paraburkholderia sp. LEh10]|uniref:TetR/AcrR family transcriptional regulator n=1 Tax=Paraburkholderia sp. LEh10 TaxID=2821353 RepID=UPI001AE3ADE4|nr:TetR/AcrR family transcriptional regulator [Paraburkholderia sp. LEh10]MBP0589030.1 TetR/AcrR family transcriptional regulator [Paraburkholderia sp. LEh10]
MGIAERKTRQKQALRERILDAARRIVMHEGFGALSMRKIADAIEYSPATLYLHFESRDAIARALCTEGYAQLLATFEPLIAIADPAERLKAIGRAYVAFGVAHPQTYRLIFMEDPSYTGAALVGGAGADAGTQDDAGDTAFRLLVEAIDALKAGGRLPHAASSEVCGEALWATLHGIVALHLTCPVFPRAPLEAVVDAALVAWFGAAQPCAANAAANVAANAGANVAADGSAIANEARNATKTKAKRNAPSKANGV